MTRTVPVPPQRPVGGGLSPGRRPIPGKVQERALPEHKRSPWGEGSAQGGAPYLAKFEYNDHPTTTSDLNPPALLHPVPSRRSSPLNPVPPRSLPFHPVSVRSIPSAVVWLRFRLICDLTRGLGSVSVMFLFYRIPIPCVVSRSVPSIPNQQLWSRLRLVGFRWLLRRFRFDFGRRIPDLGDGHVSNGLRYAPPPSGRDPPVIGLRPLTDSLQAGLT